MTLSSNQATDGDAGASITGSSTECPHCGTNLLGPAIPVEDQGFYGGKKNFSRVIGVTLLGEDRVSSWMCPDCERRDARA